MKKLMKTGFGLAAMLIGMSLPAYCTTILSFGMGGAISSGVTLSGANMDSTTFIQFNKFSETVNGVTTYFPSSLSTVADLFEMTFDNGISGGPCTSPCLSFTNNANSASTPTGQNLTGGTTPISLFSAVTNLVFTNNSSGGVLAENFSGVATGVNSTFLSELNLAPGTTFLISGGINGTYSGGTGSATSDSITFTALPEPRPVFLLGAGLMALVVIARKRRLSTAA